MTLADDIKRLLADDSVPQHAKETAKALVELVREMKNSADMIVGFTRMDKNMKWVFGVANQSAIKAAPIAALAKGE